MKPYPSNINLQMPAFMSDMTMREKIIVLLSIEGSEKSQMVSFGSYVYIHLHLLLVISLYRGVVAPMTLLLFLIILYIIGSS